MEEFQTPLEGEARQLVASVIVDIGRGLVVDLPNTIFALIQAGQSAAATVVQRFKDGQLTADEAIDELNRILETGGPLGEIDPSVVAGPSEVGGLPPPNRPLFEPTTGLFLPAIRKVAGIWGQLSPAVQSVLIQAYGIAGYGDQAAAILERRVDFFAGGGGTFSARQTASVG